MLWRLTGLYAKPSDREDLFQEILLKIWQKLPAFRGEAKLSTWAYRIGLYTGLNWRRREKVDQPLESIDRIPDTYPSASPGLNEELERLQIGLRRLRESDRTILLLAMEGFTGSEMADMLGLTENTANVRLHRARQKLQQELEILH